MHHTISVTLLNQRSEVSRLSELVEVFGRQNGLSVDDVSGVNLVLDEIVVNVMRHGYGDDPQKDVPQRDSEREIVVTLSVENKTLTIEVVDDAKPFNPLEAPPPDFTKTAGDRPVGGLGIHIVKSTVDSIAYRRDGGRNILTMTMKSTAAP